jgi:hypothetical protein
MNTPSPIEQNIAQERLRQARNTSNLALISTAIATGISLLGAALLLTGKVPEGAVTTAGGLASSLHCIRLAKDANDRLDKLLTELNDNNQPRHTKFPGDR